MALRKQRPAERCILEASLIYIESSRPVTKQLSALKVQPRWTTESLHASVSSPSQTLPRSRWRPRGFAHAKFAPPSSYGCNPHTYFLRTVFTLWQSLWTPYPQVWPMLGTAVLKPHSSFSLTVGSLSSWRPSLSPSAPQVPVHKASAGFSSQLATFSFEIFSPHRVSTFVR